MLPYINKLILIYYLSQLYIFDIMFINKYLCWFYIIGKLSASGYGYLTVTNGYLYCDVTICRGFTLSNLIYKHRESKSISHNLF